MAGLASYSSLGNAVSTNNSDTKRKGKLMGSLPLLQVAGHSALAPLERAGHDYQLRKTLSAFTVVLAEHLRAGDWSCCHGTALERGGVSTAQGPCAVTLLPLNATVACPGSLAPLWALP